MPSAVAQPDKRPRVVILGAGFGGLFAAKGLRHVKADITVVDRLNYHQFQPLLYQVAGAALAPSDVAWPIRSLLKRQKNIRVRMAEITDIDRDRRIVITDQGELPYDFLVLATGTQNHYFGHPSWAKHTLGLKDLDDATRIRAHVLRSLERAETSVDKAECRQLLTFVVIGGGPTGVETAGIIAELGRRALASDFRRIKDACLRVILVEGTERVLSTFPTKLSGYAHKALERLGVEVRTGQFVEHIEAGRVELGGDTILANTILWCAGVAPTPAAEWLGCPNERGLIPVTGRLQLPDAQEIMVVGDLTLIRDRDGNVVPGVAPVAKQQGRYAAKQIVAAIEGRDPGKEFHYRDYGMLATIGRGCAVADFGRFTMRGRLTWWLWGFSHIYFLIVRQSRWLVAFKWLFEYFTFQRGSRLILK